MKPMPIYAESIGYNNDQEKMIRTDGNPIYHWLQTIESEGILVFEVSRITLDKNIGILLTPHILYAYQAQSGNWQTFYLTFGGKILADLFQDIGLKTDTIYKWED